MDAQVRRTVAICMNMVNVQGKLSSLNKSREKQENDSHSHLTETADEDDTSRTYTTRRPEHVSLMILPALLCNSKKKLKVNVMLDPCSTGSYVTENAAEELVLTISGTGSSEVRKNSH